MKKKTKSKPKKIPLNKIEPFFGTFSTNNTSSTWGNATTVGSSIYSVQDGFEYVTIRTLIDKINAAIERITELENSK